MINKKYIYGIIICVTIIVILIFISSRYAPVGNIVDDMMASSSPSSDINSNVDLNLSPTPGIDPSSSVIPSPKLTPGIIYKEVKSY